MQHTNKNYLYESNFYLSEGSIVFINRTTT